jgi:hypothetical protein
MTMFLGLGKVPIRDARDTAYLNDPELALIERHALNSRRVYLWAFITDQL